MTKDKLLKNVIFTSLPASIAIFGALYLLSKNIYFAISIPGLLLACSVYSNVAKYKEDNRRQAAGISIRKYKSEKVYDLITVDDLGPALCFELENDKYLLVNGQWIFNPELYGEEAQQYYEEDSNYFNGYRMPYSFPSREFEIWTSDLDGNPIRINISGDYLEPEEIACELPGKFVATRLAVLSGVDINIKNCQQKNRGDRA